jgi:hypothetical protein
MNKEEIKVKVEKFVEGINNEANKSKIPVLFCVNCGSINLDQNSVFQIQCYDCRQKAFWNGLKFAIARGGHPHDVLQLVTPAQEGFWDDWHSQMNLAVHELGELLNQIPNQSDSDERKVMKENWERLKTKIDSLL